MSHRQYCTDLRRTQRWIQVFCRYFVSQDDKNQKHSLKLNYLQKASENVSTGLHVALTEIARGFTIVPDLFFQLLYFSHKYTSVLREEKK